MPRAREFRTLFHEHGIAAVQAEKKRAPESQDTAHVFFLLALVVLLERANAQVAAGLKVP